MAPIEWLQIQVRKASEDIEHARVMLVEAEARYQAASIVLELALKEQEAAPFNAGNVVPAEIKQEIVRLHEEEGLSTRKASEKVSAEIGKYVSHMTAHKAITQSKRGRKPIPDDIKSRVCELFETKATRREVSKAINKEFNTSISDNSISRIISGYKASKGIENVTFCNSRPIPDEIKKRVIELHEEELSQRKIIEQIIKEFGRSIGENTVSRIVELDKASKFHVYSMELYKKEGMPFAIKEQTDQKVVDDWKENHKGLRCQVPGVTRMSEKGCIEYRKKYNNDDKNSVELSCCQTCLDKPIYTMFEKEPIK